MKKKAAFKFLFFWLVLYTVYWLGVEYYVQPYLHSAGIRGRLKVHYIQTQIPKDEVDYLILGDSSALYAINPHFLGAKSYSAAEVGASVSRATQIFQELKIKKINKGVILGQTFIDPHYNEDIWKIFVPQKIMSLGEVLKMYCGSEENLCSSFEKAHYRLKYIWYRMHLNDYAASVINLGIKEHIWIGARRFTRYVKHNYSINKGHYAALSSPPLGNAEFFLSYRKYFQTKINPPPSEIDEIKALEEAVKKYNVKLYIVYPQLYLNDPAIKIDDYKLSYMNFMSQLSSSSLVILTPSQINIPYQRSHFRDFNHLNENGAKLFSKKLKMILEEREDAKL